MNKTPNDRLEGVIKTMIKDLEKRKDKAMIRPETEDFCTKIETLQWVLFVIFAIGNEKPAKSYSHNIKSEATYNHTRDQEVICLYTTLVDKRMVRNDSK